MKLSTKFNLVLGLVSVAGIAGSALFSYQLLQTNARKEVLNTASLMMESAMAVRSYTADEIKPLLVKQQKLHFLPQTVPAYSANQFIHEIRIKHPEYSYKEAALNPTNPSDRATDWENDVITWFKNNDGETELIGERNNTEGRILYLSHPIKITDPACLACHDTPAIAPKMLLEKYGDSNGFGWKLNDTIGAQIVSVPMALPLERADQTFYTFLALIIAVFVVIGVLLNILLYFIVTKPIVTISTQADKVSMGQLDIAELVVKGNDEVASASLSFNRMHRSLVSAFEMLEDQRD